jgi:hypothetical protein
MSFNIRKLKIQITCKERELRSCNPKSRDRIRGELKALRVALAIAMQNRIDRREAA